MDQTIRKILELDAAAEERLTAANLECKNRIQTARQQAEAIRQAQKHQTNDTIFEAEETARREFEKQAADMRVEYDLLAKSIREQYEAQHDQLIETLFKDTLREAEV
ncbi:MAG: hypothetical protein MJ071_00845 [Oscillospiraceae bacterium]|nr:hypothetical protein [Oscillospiraceae bacterium]